jgi:hypothetical protein
LPGLAKNKKSCWHQDRNAILNAIPNEKKCAAPIPKDADFDGAFHNDYLVNKLHKRKHCQR